MPTLRRQFVVPVLLSPKGAYYYSPEPAPSEAEGQRPGLAAHQSSKPCRGVLGSAELGLVRPFRAINAQRREPRALPWAVIVRPFQGFGGVAAHPACAPPDKLSDLWARVSPQ